MYAPKGDDGAGESKEGFCCTARPLTSYTPPTVTRGPENVPPRGQTAILPFLFTIQMGQEGSRSNIGAMVSTYKIETRKGVLSLTCFQVARNAKPEIGVSDFKAFVFSGNDR